MDLSVPPELEELIICSCCHQPFNDHDAVPKLFTCRHYFCLKCVNSLLREGSDELYCIHCWKRTELQGPDPKADGLPTYSAILFLTQNLNGLSLKTRLGCLAPGGAGSGGRTEGTPGGGGGGPGGGGGGGGGGSSITSNGISNCIGSEKQQRSASIASTGSNGGGGLGLSGGGGGGVTGGGSCSSAGSTSSNGGGCGGATTKLSNGCLDKLKVSENCMTHAMPNTLWCTACNILLCRACAATEEHRSHPVKNQMEAKESLHADISQELAAMQKSLGDVQHLVLKQRDFLLKILESCTTLKTQIETELINHTPTLEIAEMRESLGKARLCLDMLDKQTPAEALKLYGTLHGEKQHLLGKYQEIFLQCKLDDLIRNCSYVFDFDLIKQALIQLHNCVVGGGGGAGGIASLANLDISFGGALQHCNGMTSHHNPVLLLANYCISQLYSRQMLALKQQHQQQQQHQQHQQQQQQQQQHQQQQQLLSNGLLHSMMISNGSTGSNSGGPGGGGGGGGGGGSSVGGLGGGSSFAHTTYAQALQQNHHPQQAAGGQQQRSTNSPLPKSYADITTGGLGTAPGSNANKTNLHAQQQQQLLSAAAHAHASQQSSNNGYGGESTLAPIGTPASASAAASNAVAQRVTSAHLFSAANDLNSLGLSLLHLQHAHNSVSGQQQQQQAKSTLLLNPGVHVYPIYFFNIEINGQPSGRILIEVRSDVAPKMAKNFNALATNELGYGYKGCHIFQCWENESIITGDFELNNGRGGRSVYDEGFFMPDDTKILAIRGSVGMRRSQKRHDNLGLVGSQFRIILREMRGFTGIFAFVVDGLDLVEKISQTGDATGKPQSSVVVVSCGKYHQLG